MAADELVVVVLGVQNPGQHELVLIREAHAARRLSLDPSQGGDHDRHQQGNDRDDDQQLDERETASSFHSGVPHNSTLTGPRHGNRLIFLPPSLPNPHKYASKDSPQRTTLGCELCLASVFAMANRRFPVRKVTRKFVYQVFAWFLASLLPDPSLPPC